MNVPGTGHLCSGGKRDCDWIGCNEKDILAANEMYSVAPMQGAELFFYYVCY